MTKLAPGKGLHSAVNEEILSFIQEKLAEITSVFSDERADADAEGLQKELVSAMPGWTMVVDNFGTKAYSGMPYKTGELRVTLVLTKQDELRLDIREWFQPQQ